MLTILTLQPSEGFIDHSDFFTLDVADYIGKRASDTDIRRICGGPPVVLRTI
ncbi:MAG: hypothetical protein MZV63_20425 [Marinilabiliales bacterium]|nr:hypothetical protein [Marinilabiliales bacterium]